MPASHRATYHALVSLPEKVEVDGWLAGRRRLAVWGEAGKGWSEYREPMRSLYGPRRGRRTVALTVDAAGKRQAKAVLKYALRAVGGTLLSGPLLSGDTPRTAELSRLADDLALDRINYLVSPGLSPERADHLAEQSAAVSTLVVRLCAAGRSAHPAVTKARHELEQATQALCERAAGSSASGSPPTRRRPDGLEPAG
jgi:hypothetical protein